MREAIRGPVPHPVSVAMRRDRIEWAANNAFDRTAGSRSLARPVNAGFSAHSITGAGG
jgi:hypothetical protein